VARLDDDEGVLATEAALLLPILFFSVLLVVQFGLMMFAHIAVDQAATHAVRTVAIHGDQEHLTHHQLTGLAEQAVDQVLSDTNGVLSARVTVVTDRAGEGHQSLAQRRNGVVVVRGVAPSILPVMGNIEVHARKRAPIERWLEVGDRR
jgi:hypothetical protein